MISVIVPNYNYARYLGRRLDSILNQTYRDIEVLILDDASTDDSLAIANDYAKRDSRIRVLTNDKNSGSPYCQWLRGIQSTEGEYIWIAEADDMAEPTLLESCIRQLVAHPSVALCWTASTMIDDQDHPLSKDYDHWHRRHITAHTVSNYTPSQFAQMQYQRNCVYNASGVVFRRSHITSEAIRALEMRYSGDWLFWTMIGAQGGTIEIHERLNRFRFHNASTTHTGALAGFYEDLYVLHEIERQFTPTCWQRFMRHIHLWRRAGRMGFDTKQKRTLRMSILKRTF